MSNEESKSDLVKWRISTSFGSEPERAVYAGDRYLFHVRDADWPTLNRIVNDHNEVEEQRRRNATQEESITHLQSQQRVMKEAIEGGIEALDLSIAAMDAAAPYCARDLEIAIKERSGKAEAAIKALTSAITPKGSEQ